MSTSVLVDKSQFEAFKEQHSQLEIEFDAFMVDIADALGCDLGESGSRVVWAAIIGREIERLKASR